MGVRPARAADLDAIMRIEEEAFSSPWSRSAIAAELEPGGQRVALVAVEDEAVVGYLLAWVVADELHVLSVGVRDRHRRQGHASALLGEALDRGRERGTRLCTLEVRVGNEPARAFYARHGFRELLRRPRYYHDPVEDALVLVRFDPGGPGR